MDSGQESPFEFLQASDQNYRKRVALPLEEKPVGEEWTGLLFRVAESRFLLSMSYVQEMVSQWEIATVPGVKPWVLGLTNLHGNLISVVDFEGFLFGKNINAYSSDPKLMVVKHGNYQVGLVVSEVFGMKHFWSVDAAAVPQGIPKQIGPFLGASFNRHGEHYAALDFEKLLADKNFHTLSS